MCYSEKKGGWTSVQTWMKASRKLNEMLCFSKPKGTDTTSFQVSDLTGERTLSDHWKLMSKPNEESA